MKELAGDLVRRALELNSLAAHVAGEPTLTHQLVSQLSVAGVRCFAATTLRESEERARDDGSVETLRVFRFVAWREY